MIKVVLFDADGMVITGELFSEHLAREYKIPLKKILAFFQKEFRLCLIGKADLKEEVVKYFKDWQWRRSADDFLQLWFDWQSQADQRILKEITRLQEKDIKCCLATNQEKYRTEYLVDKVGLREVFDIIFASAWIGCRKPQEEFYDSIFQVLGVKKDEVLYWDDRKENVAAAKAFGFQAEQYVGFKDFQKKIKQHIKEL